MIAATDASTEKPAMLVLTDFPGEQPDYDILKAWLDRNKDALITSGFSAVMRHDPYGAHAVHDQEGAEGSSGKCV